MGGLLTMDGITTMINNQAVQLSDNMAQGGAAVEKKPSAKNTVSPQVATEALVKKMQAVLSSTDISVGFTKYGDKTAAVVYSKETGKVIREIPQKEIQQLQMRMEEMIGMIFNNSA